MEIISHLSLRGDFFAKEPKPELKLFFRKPEPKTELFFQMFESPTVTLLSLTIKISFFLQSSY